MTTMLPDHRFRREHRLRTRGDFQRVYAHDFVVADDVLVIRACPAPCGSARLGLAVSRKVGNAVVRNRWKRRIREAFRLNRQKLPTGIDFVVRPRRGAKCDFHAIEASLPRLATRVANKIRKTSR